MKIIIQGKIDVEITPINPFDSLVAFSEFHTKRLLINFNGADYQIFTVDNDLVLRKSNSNDNQLFITTKSLNSIKFK